MKSYQIVFLLATIVLAFSNSTLANSILFWGHLQPSEAVLASSSEPYRVERPRMNDSAEVVWTEQLSDTDFNIVSNSRGVIAGGAGTRRDPDINNGGEVIWRFGDGGSGANGISSNVRGTILSSTSIDPNYDSARINSNGEVIASRAGSPERLWSNQRGFLPSSGDFIRAPELNDAGEVVYMSHLLGIQRSIRSTVQGLIASNSLGLFDPDINNLGEIVWEQPKGAFGGAPGTTEIWSNLRGKLGDGQNPSISDSGEVVWEYWDGVDFEIYSSVRGQLTFNLKMDTEPNINSLGDIAWLRSLEDSSIPEPSAIALAAIAAAFAWGRSRHRVCRC